MNRELRRKDPAVILAVGDQVRDSGIREEVWSDSRYALLDRIHRAERRGEIAVIGQWHPIRGWPGRYSVRVQRLRPAAPRWRRPLLWSIAGAVPLAALVVIGHLILSALAGVILMLIGGAAMAGGILLLAFLAYGGDSISITQNVSIRR